MSKARNLAGFAGSISSNNDLNVGIITATSFVGDITVSAGSTSSPSLKFSASSTTGIYSPGSNQLSLVTAGTGRITIDASGNVVAGGTLTAGSFIPTSSTVPTNGLYLSAANTLALATNSAGRVFIDSSGRLGLGTSSPNQLLDVRGNSNPQLKISETNNSTSAGVYIENQGQRNWQIWANRATDTLNFGANARANTFLAINGATGRVGVGTTTPFSSLHVNRDSANPTVNLTRQSNSATTLGESIYLRMSDNWAAANSRMEIGMGYQNSSGTVVYAPAIIGYVQTNGSGVTNGDIYFATRTATTDTAPVERARIDSSGRLLVGTSSYSGNATLVLENNSSGTSFGHLRINRNSSSPADGNTLGLITFSDNTTSYSADIYAARDGGTWSASSKPTRLVFSTTADGSSSPTERLRIDSSGRVGFEYSSVNGVINDWGHGGYRGISANTNSTTLSDQKASWFLRGSVQGTNNELGNTILLLQDSGGAAINKGDLIKGYTSTSFVFRVANNGAVQNSPNSYGALSDQRLKQDIEDAGSQWDDIKQIKVRKFKFQSEPDANPYIGVIAQEIESVSPGLIDQALLEDGTPDPDSYKSVKYSVLYMKAVKALQEAMERIETLESSNADLLARVTALETP